MGGKVCAIIGYGPGLGAAYAQTFSQAGYDLGLLSRSGAGFGGADVPERSVRAYKCDAGNPDSLKGALSSVESDHGPIDVVIYNADLARFGALDDISELRFEQSWRVGVLGLFATAKLLGTRMADRGSGTFIVSGATAALRGNVWTTAFAPSKSAQRTLANSLAKQLGPKGVHVAYLVIDGVIDTEDTRTNFAPDEPDDWYGKNCAHPLEFADSPADNRPWQNRLRYIRPNAVVMDQIALCKLGHLEDGDPAELGQQLGDVARQFPQADILGGCCGTDERHPGEIASNVNALRKNAAVLSG